MQAKRSPAERFWAKVSRTDGCWLWTGSTRRHGYGQFHFNRRTVPAHRMAWMLTRGAVPGGLLVCHHCDVRACVNPDHLFLGTVRDNAQDALAKGRLSPPPEYHHLGITHHAARLTDDAVRTIRRMRTEGALLRQLAAEFGVSISTVHGVLQGRSWGHVL